MQALKDLYLNRHYTQCAKFGERLLGEVDTDVSRHTRCALLDHTKGDDSKQKLTVDRYIQFTWHI
jgi:hypothetical protein